MDSIILVWMGVLRMDESGSVLDGGSCGGNVEALWAFMEAAFSKVEWL